MRKKLTDEERRIVDWLIKEDRTLRRQMKYLDAGDSIPLRHSIPKNMIFAKMTMIRSTVHEIIFVAHMRQMYKNQSLNKQQKKAKELNMAYEMKLFDEMMGERLLVHTRVATKQDADNIIAEMKKYKKQLGITKKYLWEVTEIQRDQKIEAPREVLEKMKKTLNETMQSEE